MATIARRRNRQDQSRATRRTVTIVLLFLVLATTLRVSLTTIESAITSFRIRKANSSQNDAIVVLTLQLDDDTFVDISLQLLERDAPQAARYVRHLATAKNETCRKCTLYRGEPVPPYWGSLEYPDRYFDEGRWGPPYALVQGQLRSDFQQDVLEIPSAEKHTPIVERGMVAWAGGKGGPHFFIALAQHPEWGHGHTVWGRVLEQDLDKVDALVLSRPLATTRPKQPPIVSTFVTPIPLVIRMQE